MQPNKSWADIVEQDELELKLQQEVTTKLKTLKISKKRKQSNEPEFVKKHKMTMILELRDGTRRILKLNPPSISTVVVQIYKELERIEFKMDPNIVDDVMTFEEPKIQHSLTN